MACSENKNTVAQFKAMGLVNIQDINPNIQVDLKYATTDNFTGKIVYTDFKEAFFVKEVALRLSRIQDRLTSLRPGYRLLIYDAARPFSVQKRFFDYVKGTEQEQYVANPAETGLHNYGIAVDLTIIDDRNIPLDMGVGFDYFGPEAHTNNEEKLLQERKITPAQIENRKFLRNMMSKEKFEVLANEWWHFNGYPLEVAKKSYQLLDF